MAKKPLSAEVLAFFRKIGRKGGRNRAKKHNQKQLKAWARMGGRPRKAA